MTNSSPVLGALHASDRYREVIAKRGPARVRAGECPVCLGQHEEEIHSATVRVRRWFRSEVTRGFVRHTVS
jgi:hypothetical protein